MSTIKTEVCVKENTVIGLEHVFVNKCKQSCKEALVKDVTTLRRFMRNIEKESKKQSPLIFKDEDTFKGEAFECFVEFLNKTYNGLYIRDYKLLEEQDRDTGVDALGIGKNNKPATVQIKYRSNTTQLLTANEDHLSNFTSTSLFKYGVNVNDSKNMLIFTTAKDLHHFTCHEMFLDKVTCIGFNEISTLVNNDKAFWAGFAKSLLSEKAIKTKKALLSTLKIKELYKHQKEALEAVEKNTKGIVYLPTGTGKTTIIARAIINVLKNNPSVAPIVVASPRIILTKQILDDIREELIIHGINCKYLNVNSGKAIDEKKLRDLEETLGFLKKYELESTTSPSRIKEIYENCKKEKTVLVILAVYDSVCRIKKSGIPVSNLYCDEAHYLVENDFNYITDQSTFIDAHKYYFTATLKETESEDSVGMNNKNKYGEIIYQKSSAEMVEEGVICRPRLHVISSIDSFYIPASATTQQKEAIDPHAILVAFEEHKALCKSGAKLLVICKGTEHLEGICSSPYFINYLKSHPNINIYSITSQTGAKVTRDLNGDGILTKDEIGVKIPRAQMLKEIKELKDSDDAIIFHIDILTEGIDVPGITAIIPLAQMKDFKMTQNAGRASRLDPIDKQLLKDKELSTDFSRLNEYGESEEALRYRKPYFYVIVPRYTEDNMELKAKWEILLRYFRTFNFNPKYDIVMTDNKGSRLPKPINILNQEQKDIKGITANVVHLVNEIETAEKAGIIYKEKANATTLEEMSEIFM